MRPGGYAPRGQPVAARPRQRIQHAAPAPPMIAALLTLTLAASEGPTAAGPPVDLNPFGSLFALASWVLLVAVNGFCLWRALKPPAAPLADGSEAPVAGAPPATPATPPASAPAA